MIELIAICFSGIKTIKQKQTLYLLCVLCSVDHCTNIQCFVGYSRNISLCFGLHQKFGELHQLVNY